MHPMPNAAAARRPSESTPVDPMLLVRARADALHRAAVECCRQHDRAARLSTSHDDPELEHEQLDALCRICDAALLAIADEYTRAAGDLHPDRDEAWWHRANSLWHASREYARRHAGGEEVSRRVSGRHSAGELGAVQMEYELHASSLLALRHAADAYRKTRPDLA
jgi:hypothetical protein